MNTGTFSTKEQRRNRSIYFAPLNSTERARLEITNGISNCDLAGDLPNPDLFQAQFSSLIPKVSVQNRTVTIRYELSLTERIKHAFLCKQHAAGYRSLRLSPRASIYTVEWRIYRQTYEWWI